MLSHTALLLIMEIQIIYGKSFDDDDDEDDDQHCTIFIDCIISNMLTIELNQKFIECKNFMFIER